MKYFLIIGAIISGLITCVLGGILESGKKEAEYIKRVDGARLPKSNKRSTKFKDLEFMDVLVWIAFACPFLFILFIVLILIYL